RTWKKGDQVSVEFPMGIYTEQLPDHSNYYSILYGPLVLAAKTGTEDMDGLFADDSRMGHVAHGRQVPLRNMPILTTPAENIPKLVQPIADKPLHFSLSGLYQGTEERRMELQPFHQTHDSRYIIYWPQATQEELAALQEKTEQEEKESLRLAALTFDRVVSGAQQPEPDHLLQEENTQAGSMEDVRWREAKGWFSYALKPNPKEDVQLYIRYLEEENRKTVVFVDDQEVGKLQVDSNTLHEIKTTIISVPETLNKENTFQIKIGTEKDATSHKILEIRVIKKKS